MTENKIRWTSNGSVSFYTINKVSESGSVFDSMVRPTSNSGIMEPIILPHLQEDKKHKYHLDLIDLSGKSKFYCNENPILNWQSAHSCSQQMGRNQEVSRGWLFYAYKGGLLLN